MAASGGESRTSLLSFPDLLVASGMAVTTFGGGVGASMHLLGVQRGSWDMDEHRCVMSGVVSGWDLKVDVYWARSRLGGS